LARDTVSVPEAIPATFSSYAHLVEGGGGGGIAIARERKRKREGGREKRAGGVGGGRGREVFIDNQEVIEGR
jgi:hypothetical protein